MKSKRTMARESQEILRRTGHLMAMKNALASAIRDGNAKAIPYFKDQIAKTQPLVDALQS